MVDTQHHPQPWHLSVHVKSDGHVSYGIVNKDLKNIVLCGSSHRTRDLIALLLIDAGVEFGDDVRIEFKSNRKPKD